MRGTISRRTEWDVPVDLFFYREPEELERAAEEQMAEATEMRPPGAPTGPEVAPVAQTGFGGDNVMLDSAGTTASAQMAAPVSSNGPVDPSPVGAEWNQPMDPSVPVNQGGAPPPPQSSGWDSAPAAPQSGGWDDSAQNPPPPSGGSGW